MRKRSQARERRARLTSLVAKFRENVRKYLLEDPVSVWMKKFAMAWQVPLKDGK